jgi:hypothetical protein
MRESSDDKTGLFQQSLEGRERPAYFGIAAVSLGHCIKI